MTITVSRKARRHPGIAPVGRYSQPRMCHALGSFIAFDAHALADCSAKLHPLEPQLSELPEARALKS